MSYHRSPTRLIPVVLFLILTPKVAAQDQAPAQEGPKHRRVAGIRDVTGSVSPDGRYYAFTNWQTGQLGVKDLSTGENRYIVTPGSEGEWPYQARFGPDGRRIAYEWIMQDGVELRVINADGSGVRTLYRGGGEVHDWSPDGKHILANVERGTVLISISDGSLEVLSDWLPSLEIRLSPDGRYIAYDVLVRDDSPDRDIFLLEIDGGQKTPLVEGPGIERVLDWTPDGKRLLFDSDRGLLPGAGRRAWLIEVADGKPTGESVLVEPEIRALRGLGFSHDGAYFYCCGGEDADTSPTSLYLARLDPATGELSAPEMITSVPGAVVQWSPDGQYFAYAWHQWPLDSFRRDRRGA
jgi:Tol biopolymer transport system component